jgi:hypothetical protein
MNLPQTCHRHEFIRFTNTICFSHLQILGFIFIPSLLFRIFLSFFLILTYFYILIVGEESFWSTSSHSRTHIHTHTHTQGRTPLDEESDNTQHSEERDIHVPGGMRTSNSSKRAAADPRFRPRGHRDRLSLIPPAKINISLPIQVYQCDACS